MKPTLPTLALQYRRAGNLLPTVEEQMDELYRFVQAIAEFSPLFSRWFLASDKSREDALRYEAFDDRGPRAVALDVVRADAAGVTDIRSVGLWNGAEGKGDSASLVSRCNVLGRPDAFEFRLKVRPEVVTWHTGASWISEALKIWPASYATFGPFWHNESQVFKDRPGVGWMLYLPRVLTAQQVPEARALVPVMSRIQQGKEAQTGTIIVSVTDEPFSDENPEHVKIANDIEVRLVDQDLLPRYADL